MPGFNLHALKGDREGLWSIKVNGNWRITFLFEGGLSLMKMHNPPHPGEFIKEVYLEELRISEREVALKLKVSPSTFNRLIQGKSNLSPEMALRLSKTLGRTAESWQLMQDRYSLWMAEQSLNLDDVEVLEISA